MLQYPTINDVHKETTGFFNYDHPENLLLTLKNKIITCEVSISFTKKN